MAAEASKRAKRLPILLAQTRLAYSKHNPVLNHGPIHSLLHIRKVDTELIECGLIPCTTPSSPLSLPSHTAHHTMLHSLPSHTAHHTMLPSLPSHTAHHTMLPSLLPSHTAHHTMLPPSPPTLHTCVLSTRGMSWSLLFTFLVGITANFFNRAARDSACDLFQNKVEVTVTRSLQQ